MKNVQQASNILIMNKILYFIFGISITTMTYGISIRDDVPEANYFSLASPFDAVGRITNSGLVHCTGNLVAPSTILTAAHCVDDNNDGLLDVLPSDLQFLTGSNVSNPSNAVTISSISVNPLWASSGGSEQYDLSVLTLSAPIITVTPLAISAGNAAGRIGTMVGYGGNGTGATPFADNIDGLRRAAQNVIDVAGTSLQTDFDSPQGNTDTTGSPIALALEGTTAGGDSGGALLVDFGSGNTIVGILNSGFNPFNGGSEYGDIAIWASINDADNLTFLSANGITPVTLSETIPEPSTWILFTLLGIGIVVQGYMRKKQKPRLQAPTSGCDCFAVSQQCFTNRQEMFRLTSKV